jgi:hypothetical protein
LNLKFASEPSANYANFGFAALTQFTVPWATDPVKSRRPAPAAFAGLPA